MILEEYKKIKNKKYSPKELLAYLIISIKNTKEINLNKLLKSFEKQLLENLNNKDIYNKIDSKLLYEIKNYWDLSTKEILAYAYIVFYILTFEEKELTEKQILITFIYVMRLYSPGNALDFVKSKLKIV